jgi:hypothetical protein
MKKISLILFLIFFFVYSQEVSAKDPAPTPVPSPTPIDYFLPYPGVLPDNPLYSLKVFRDRIVGFLISDPLKKSEYDLLQADKRLNTSIYLFKGGQSKYSLAESTLSKGENYFQDAITNIKRAKQQGEFTNDLLARLYVSSLKHQESIKQFENNTQGDLRQRFMMDEKRMIEFQNAVNQLRLKQ